MPDELADSGPRHTSEVEEGHPAVPEVVRRERRHPGGYAGSHQCRAEAVGSEALEDLPLGDAIVVMFRLSDASGITVTVQSSRSYSDGNWHHVVGVRSGTSVLLYVDGVQAASATESLGDIDAPSAQARIAAAVPPVMGENFRGDLDETSIYARSLSSTEVAQRYKEGLGVACSDVAGASSATYTLGAADSGFAMRVVETASNAAGIASAASTQVGPVVALLTYQQLQAGGLPLPMMPADFGLPLVPKISTGRGTLRMTSSKPQSTKRRRTQRAPMIRLRFSSATG